MPPVSPGGCSSGSNPGFFQITASALCLRAGGILCTPFKSEVSVSNSPLTKPCWSSKPDILGAHLPSGGAQCGARTPHFSGRISAILIILPFVDHPPRGLGLDRTASLPLLPVLLCFLLYNFSFSRSFLLVFRSFSSIVAL